MIYFIESSCKKKIKIGYTDRSGINRMNELKPNCGKLRLLKEINGDTKIEQAIHILFARLRLHGEWFKATEELRAFIMVYGISVFPEPVPRKRKPKISLGLRRPKGSGSVCQYRGKYRARKREDGKDRYGPLRVHPFEAEQDLTFL